MYKCSEINSINIRYVDGTDRSLNADEIKNICELANKNENSIEMLLKKQEQKEVRYVEINKKQYISLKGDNGTILKPMPPY
ncbi:MAG: hypothetical protein QXZ44_01630 [Ferroplasma sp.]